MATLTTVFSNCSAAVTSNLSVSAAAQRGRAPRAYTSRHVQGSVPPAALQHCSTAALQYAETRAAGELGQRGFTLTAIAPGLTYNVTMLRCISRNTCWVMCVLLSTQPLDSGHVAIWARVYATYHHGPRVTCGSPDRGESSVWTVVMLWYQHTFMHVGTCGEVGGDFVFR